MSEPGRQKQDLDHVSSRKVPLTAVASFKNNYLQQWMEYDADE